MFFFNDADWLIIADYYSKLSIVRKMPRPCLSSRVVSVTEHIFSETGVPSRVVTDNGPHFAILPAHATQNCDVFTEISTLKRIH